MNKATKSRALWGSGRGQSLVEFALVLPMLLVVAFMITEFGRALWIKNALTGAAGVAARAAIVSNATKYKQVATDAADRVLAPQFMGIGDAYPATTIETELNDINGGQQTITVRLRREFSFIPRGPEGLPANPGARGAFARLGTVVIVGETVMETQPSFGG